MTDQKIFRKQWGRTLGAEIANPLFKISGHETKGIRPSMLMNNASLKGPQAEHRHGVNNSGLSKEFCSENKGMRPSMLMNNASLAKQNTFSPPE